MWSKDKEIHKTMDKIKLENNLMKLLKTHEVTISLYKTPIGELAIKRGKDETDYTYILDGVVLPKELQKDLRELFNGQINT